MAWSENRWEIDINVGEVDEVAQANVSTISTALRAGNPESNCIKDKQHNIVHQ